MLSTPDVAAHVADTVREPLLVLDGALVVIAANRAFYRVFAVTPEETIGVSITKLGDGQWNRPELRRLLEEVLPQQSEFEVFEVADTFPRIGSRVMWLSAREIVTSGTVGTLPAGDAASRTILLAIEDVSARRVAEEALVARTRELEESNRELERFATVASHDLQEPLRKIRTYGELLRQRHADSLDAGARAYVERMSQAAERMQCLIQDLLTLSRVTAHSRTALPVKLDRVVREVLVDLEVSLREAGGHVIIGELPVVIADPVQMRQLFQNLLSNALKFRRPDTPPAIAVKSEAPPGVDARFPSFHIISVQDNGIGFAQRYADQIFEPFGRLHGRGEYGGTGIGLAICRRIVERHGGAISARSAPGAGASFLVSLPVRRVVSSIATAPSTDPAAGPSAPFVRTSGQALR